MSSLPSNPDQIGGPGPGEHHLLQRILGHPAQPSVFFFFSKSLGKKTWEEDHKMLIFSDHQIKCVNSISFQQGCFNSHHITQLYMEHAKSEWVWKLYNV